MNMKRVLILLADGTEEMELYATRQSARDMKASFDHTPSRATSRGLGGTRSRGSERIGKRCVYMSAVSMVRHDSDTVQASWSPDCIT